MNLNLFKSNVFPTGSLRQKHRLFLKEEEINEFWNARTLIEMEQLLTIRNQDINQYVYRYIDYYLKEKKITQTDAYQVARNSNFFMCLYDCKIFKSNNFQKQINEMLTSFMFAYRVPTSEEDLKSQIFQFYDSAVFHEANSIIKCKASFVLKQYSLLKTIVQYPIDGDTIIFTQEYYYPFFINWMNSLNYLQTLKIEFMIQHLFKGLMILLQNSILVAFSNTLSEQQKERRRYKEPVNIIKKPKNIESSTMIYQGLGEIEWHTLKIKVFKLKYKVMETEEQYSCFRVKRDQEEEEDIEYDPQFMQQGDDNLLQGFRKITWIQQT